LPAFPSPKTLAAAIQAPLEIVTEPALILISPPSPLPSNISGNTPPTVLDIRLGKPSVSTLSINRVLATEMLILPAFPFPTVAEVIAAPLIILKEP
jgi:hypothetical protein